jgi:uncharacterized protein DUF2188
MTKVVYKIMKHENGWAYQARGTISETFPSHDAALEAAKRAAGEQKVPGETVGIQYEGGREVARGARSRHRSPPNRG